VLTWKLVGVKLISANVSYGIYAVLSALLIQQMSKIIRVNSGVARGEMTPRPTNMPSRK